VGFILVRDDAKAAEARGFRIGKREPAGNITLDEAGMTAMLAGGARWAFEQGDGRASDLERIEEGGCAADADPAAVSDDARRRQRGAIACGPRSTAHTRGSRARAFSRPRSCFEAILNTSCLSTMQRSIPTGCCMAIRSAIPSLAQPQASGGTVLLGGGILRESNKLAAKRKPIMQQNPTAYLVRNPAICRLMTRKVKKKPLLQGFLASVEPAP
jgi:hypothetical protein